MFIRGVLSAAIHDHASRMAESEGASSACVFVWAFVCGCVCVCVLVFVQYARPPHLCREVGGKFFCSAGPSVAFLWSLDCEIMAISGSLRSSKPPAAMHDHASRVAESEERKASLRCCVHAGLRFVCT